MKPTINIDAGGWQRAARELFQTSSRTCVDFTNGQALKVAVESVRQTERANRQQLQHTLGVISRDVSFHTTSRGRNKGKVRVKLGMFRATDEIGRESFAARILGARFRATGSFGVKGETMAERVHNLIVSRSRAISFIASGWIGARNKLWSLVKKKPAKMRGFADARQFGRPKGSASPATFGLGSKIEAQIVNSALMANAGKPPSTGGDPMPVAEKGLQRALNVAAQDMTEELARRLNPDIEKFNRG